VSLRAKLKPKRRGTVGRPVEKDAPAFLRFVRKHPCILEDTGECRGKVRACHWDEAGDKGTSTKVADRFTLPMCDGHHHEQTEVLGWPKFQAKYAFSAEAFCATLWKSWPGLSAWNRAVAGNPRTRIDAPMVLR